MKADLKKRAGKLKAQIPAVYLALREPRTPWYAKALAGITVVYALSPVDLIPDFIPLLGYLDDLILLPALAALTVKSIPPQLWEEMLAKAENLWENGKPKKWYFALPIVLLWLAVICAIVKALI